MTNHKEKRLAVAATEATEAKPRPTEARHHRAPTEAPRPPALAGPRASVALDGTGVRGMGMGMGIQEQNRAGALGGQAATGRGSAHRDEVRQAATGRGSSAHRDEVRGALHRALVGLARQGEATPCQADADLSPLWTSPKSLLRARVAPLCAGCPLRVPCEAVGQYESAGVWGGQDRDTTRGTAWPFPIGRSARPPVPLGLVCTEHEHASRAAARRCARHRYRAALAPADTLPDPYADRSTADAPAANLLPAVPDCCPAPGEGELESWALAPPAPHAGGLLDTRDHNTRLGQPRPRPESEQDQCQ